MDISIVVPVYNEEGNLAELVERIKTALSPLTVTWEAIFVDDGSTDGSAEVLRKLAAEDERIKLVVFRRNFGQTSALAAGFRHASGDVIITMDADLQNDPADIPRLLEKLNEGYDIVSGWRKDRKDDVLTRKIPSRA